MFPSPLNHYLDALAALVFWWYRCGSHTHGVILKHWRKVRVRHYSIKGAVNLAWDLAYDLEVVDRALEAAGFHEAGKLRRPWKRLCHWGQATKMPCHGCV